MEITMHRHAINGKSHYFDWAIFNSYVKLPEGIYYDSWLLINPLSQLCGPVEFIECINATLFGLGGWQIQPRHGCGSDVIIPPLLLF